MVDPDNHTNTFIYNAPHPNNAWQVTEVHDPYGRNASLTYDINSGLLTGIINAAGNLSSFAYAGDGSGWITSQTTPYGPTSFACYQAPYPGVTNGFSQRAALVSEPMGAGQLFYYAHTNSLVPATANAPTGVPGQTFDDGTCGGSGEAALTFRNSFHWDRLQFEALSSTVVATLTTNLPAGLAALSTSDFRRAGLKHWLWQTDQISISQSLSSERQPSADAAGLLESPRTWYNYATKMHGCDTEGDAQVGSIARLLPDGSTQYGLYQYNPRTGLVLCNAETYSLANGQTGTRTNWFNYAFNGVNLAGMSNSAGQWVGFAWNTNHQVIFATNALNQVTSLGWDPMSHNLTNLSLPSGQSVGLGYAGLLSSITLSPQNLNIAIAAYSCSLPQAVHAYGGGIDLWLTNSWDSLNRFTGTLFPDGTTVSNIYTWLDLTAQRDRLGNWTHYGYDGLQHLTSITDSLSNATQLSWCDCGSLGGILDALNHPTTLNYNNQGLLTNVTFPDGSSLWCQYDSAQRLTQVVNGQGQGLTYGYNNQGLVTVVSNAYGPVWQAAYDVADRPSSLTNANKVALTFQYDLLNRVTSRLWSDGIAESFVWATNGIIAYTNRNGKATLFTRDGAGRLLGVTNANQEVAALAYGALNQVTDLWDGRTNHTGWSYNNYGWLATKMDARGSTVATYLYDPNGQLTNRWTPQVGNTAYAYDPVGNLRTISYPQSSVSYFYDALNRLTNMVDAAGASFLGYTPVGQLQSEYGRWANDTVSIGYTQQLRQALSLAQPGGANWSQIYGYDTAFRLQSLAASSGAFAYGYGTANPASALVRTLGLPNGAWVTNHYDSLDRLDYTGLLDRWGHVLDGYGYTGDPLGLRTNLTRNLGLTTNSLGVGYDSIGQLVFWSGKETGGALRQNEQFGFGYDRAHNLNSRTNGALIQTFNTDVVNQLTNITRSGALTVSGATTVPATNVTVNGQAAQTYADFTFASQNNPLTNGQNSFTIVARNTYGLGTTNIVSVNLPSSVALQYDLNGNLTNDGTRSFAYDAEDRLATNWVAGAWKSEFVYDGLGRRRIERDYSWNAGTWQLTNETHCIYDGWLVVQERNSNNVVQVTYTRGLDLSGTLQYAGGIGGLLARTDTSGSAYYHSDGAGNVTGLIDANENMAARYLYGPFGRVTAQWGPLAAVNAMQFSSMPRHANSGMSLYPFRAYDPALQRWLARDPVGEWGGLNLYAFVANNALNNIDPGGLNWFTDWWHNLWHIHGGNASIDPDSLQALKNAAGVGATPLTDENGNIVQPGDVLEGALLDAGVTIAMMGLGGPEDRSLYDAGDKLTQLASRCKRTRNPRFHHPWPQYLGGPLKQTLQKLPKSLHDEYHRGLDEILPRWRSSEYYKALSPQEQAESFARFLEYTEAFDQQYGTHLADALKRVAAAMP